MQFIDAFNKLLCGFLITGVAQARGYILGHFHKLLGALQECFQEPAGIHLNAQHRVGAGLVDYRSLPNDYPAVDRQFLSLAVNLARRNGIILALLLRI